MSEPNRGLSERVEVFTRATSDALQKAVGEVLDARSPWQLLYRLSRIVLLGLVLYTAWLLITLQPELARRMSTARPALGLEQQVAARQGQVQALLRRPIATSGSALHTLVLLQWEGGGSARVLAAEGRHAQFGLLPDQVSLLGVELAEALGHVALGLCTSQQQAAPPLAATTTAAVADRMLFCPVRSGRSGHQGGVLLAFYAPPPPGQSPQPTAVVVAVEQQMLQLLAQQLADLLAGE